jgi:hypothetical protein
METKELLGARYRLEHRLATGGMGDVWAARDELLGRTVALKLLHPHLASDGDFRRRFRNEAKAVARLSHPGIVGIFDYGEDADVAFLAMELVDGEPLHEVLLRERFLGPSPAMSLVAQAADALGAAHREGLVHRDVKPANLLVRTDGRVKVTDFGIVRITGLATMTHAGTVLGTVSYMSPEQVRGERVTPASDIYSLGVVAFECLSGRRPFDGDDSIAVALAHLREPVPGLPDRIPAGIRELVTAMLQKEPRARPDSAALVARTARRLASGAPSSAPALPSSAASRGARGTAAPCTPGLDGGDADRPRSASGTGPRTQPYGAADRTDLGPGMTAVFDLHDAVALAGIARDPVRDTAETEVPDGPTAAGRGPSLRTPLGPREGSMLRVDRAPRQWLRVAGAAGVALVIALLMSTSFSAGTSASAPKRVPVPALGGLTLQQAEHRLLALGLHASTGAADPSPSALVTGESPRTRTRVRRGSTVVLTVSASPSAPSSTTTTPPAPTAPVTTAPPPATGHGPGPGGDGPPGHGGTGPPGHGP